MHIVYSKARQDCVCVNALMWLCVPSAPCMWLYDTQCILRCMSSAAWVCVFWCAPVLPVVYFTKELFVDALAKAVDGWVGLVAWSVWKKWLLD